MIQTLSFVLFVLLRKYTKFLFSVFNSIAHWTFVPCVAQGQGQNLSSEFILSPLIIFTRGRDKILFVDFIIVSQNFKYIFFCPHLLEIGLTHCSRATANFGLELENQ